jgi:hypothetical protein
MTALQILRISRLQPFQPFAMHLADQRVLVVRHPELIALTGGGRIAIVEKPDGVSEIVDVLMIISLRPLTDAEVLATR